MTTHAPCAVLLCTAVFFIADATAQTAPSGSAATYPNRPIRIVVPFPPGGTSDILTRLIGAKVTANWGQQIIADNRTGANGNIAAEFVARSAPDGYTLMLTDLGNLSISQSLYKLTFDVLRDFQQVTTVSYSPHLLTVHPSVPVKTVKELIALAKANPGKLNYATGLGSAPHLAGLMFARRTGINWVYVPTRGGASSVLAVATGDGDVLVLGMLQTLPHVNAGKLKLVAVSSEQRLPSISGTPTVAEMPGLEGFVTGSWQGIVAPAKTPSDVIAKLNGEIARILALPDIKEVLSSQGTVGVGNSPQDSGKWMAGETARWAKLIQETGIKLQE